MFLGNIAAAEARAFIGVVSNKYVHVVEIAILVHAVLVIRDHIAVYYRPGASGDDHLAREGAGVHGAQLSQRLGAEAFGVLDAVLLCHGEGFHVLAWIGVMTHGAEGTAALRNCTADQALGKRRCAEHADGDAAGGLAEDSHLGRVAAEGRYIVVDPLQGGDLVHDTVVAGHVVGALGSEFGMGEITELSDTVIDRHKYDALLRERTAVILRR